MAGANPTFVDDMRPIGSSPEECWKVLHRVASWYGFLGIQFAARKTRPPSQIPGAWAGSVVCTGDRGIVVSCAQDKWDNGKWLLQELLLEVESESQIAFKPLEQKRGFLIHLQRSYTSFTSFLKGFHLTLDSWCPNRDSEGWKLPEGVLGY